MKAGNSTSMSAGFPYCTGYVTVYPDWAMVGYIGELIGIIYEPSEQRAL